MRFKQKLLFLLFLPTILFGQRRPTPWQEDDYSEGSKSLGEEFLTLIAVLGVLGGGFYLLLFIIPSIFGKKSSQENTDSKSHEISSEEASDSKSNGVLMYVYIALGCLGIAYAMVYVALLVGK
jgi:hypothetical protein